VAWLAKRTTTPVVLLALLLLAFGALVGVAILTGELLELAERRDGSTAFDSSITTWAVANRTEGLTTAARVLSTVGSQAVLLPVSAVVAVLLVGRRRLVPAGLLVACWGGGLALYSITKLVVQRQRPPTEIWLTKVAGTSFPSGHATQSLAALSGLALVSVYLLPMRRVGALAVAVVLAAGIGWSRVYLGVHWATDVGAGWLFAGLWVAMVIRLALVARQFEQRSRTGR
jgi:membrane-associated phospholipid phosphatase